MSRYHEDYLEELEKDVEAARSYRYKRDREAYEYERELGSYRSYPPPIDDPYYRHYDELESRMRGYPSVPPSRDSLRGGPPHDYKDEGIYIYGSVSLIPPSPFEEKPKRNVKPPGCNTVFVGSLPDNMTEKHIIELFSECGRVVDVRIPRGKRYAHVEFTREEAVDKAIEVSNCTVRVGPVGIPGNVGRLYVDFAHHRGEGEVHKKIQEGEMMLFNNRSVTVLNNNLHYDEAFDYVAKNVVHWFEKGHCDTTTVNIFYSLLTNIHTYCRKVAKNVKTKDEELKEVAASKSTFFGTVQTNCESLKLMYCQMSFMCNVMVKGSHCVKKELLCGDIKTTLQCMTVYCCISVGLMQQIYEAAAKQKSWDSFTKAQRKTITQWKEHAAVR